MGLLLAGAAAPGVAAAYDPNAAAAMYGRGSGPGNNNSYYYYSCNTMYVCYNL